MTTQDQGTELPNREKQQELFLKIADLINGRKYSFIDALTVLAQCAAQLMADWNGDKDKDTMERRLRGLAQYIHGQVLVIWLRPKPLVDQDGKPLWQFPNKPIDG
jgi:hypothetical protein